MQKIFLTRKSDGIIIVNEIVADGASALSDPDFVAMLERRQVDPALCDISYVDASNDEVSSYITNMRRMSYPKELSIYLEAIIEKFIENRPEKMDALQAEREAIKAKYPKV